MINLYIARKVIKFEPNSNQEIRYKKFLLVNTLLALKLLTNTGNLIFKNFENVSIFKPVSTRQYSSTRFLVAENYLGEKKENNSIIYLKNYFNKYIEFTQNGYDVRYFFFSL